MVRPLEKPVRAWTSRRGGGGVDEVGGRLRRPGRPPHAPAPRLFRGTRVCRPLRTAWPGRRKRPHATPLHTRPYASGGRSPKTLLLRAALGQCRAIAKHAEPQKAGDASNMI
jgi:hypothetical protein